MTCISPYLLITSRAITLEVAHLRNSRRRPWLSRTTHRPPPTVHHLRRTTHRALLVTTTHRTPLMTTTHHPPNTTHHSPHTTHHSPLTIHCPTPAFHHCAHSMWRWALTSIAKESDGCADAILVLRVGLAPHCLPTRSPDHLRVCAPIACPLR